MSPQSRNLQTSLLASQFDRDETCQTLLRLAQNPRDGWALIQLWALCETTIREAHWRLLEDDLRCRGADLDTLFRVADKARTFDPTAKEPLLWIRAVIEEEFTHMRAARYGRELTGVVSDTAADFEPGTWVRPQEKTSVLARS
jgi:hypothetical protein